MRRLALALLILGGLLLGLAVAETAIRVYETAGGPKKHDVGIEDPVRHHRWMANAHGRVHGIEYRTNSLGLRDREYPEAGPPGGLRILLLGDSFTEGSTLDFEDTVAKRMERDLAARCRRPHEVINGGNASYSPILEYLLLKEIGPRLRPDIVVLNFDMTDVHDDFVRTRLARFDAQNLPVAVPGERRRDFAQVLLPLGPSPVLSALDPLNQALKSTILYQRFRKSSLGQRALGSLSLSPERLAELDLVGNIQYDVLAITRAETSPELEAAWALTQRYIVAIRDSARAQGAAFVLAVYPYAHQVSATASAQGRRKFGMGPGLHASDAPFRILEDLGRRERFPVINLRRHFQAAIAVQERDGTPPLYWPHDIHFTPHGARVFAEGMEIGLRRHGLLSC